MARFLTREQRLKNLIDLHINLSEEKANDNIITVLQFVYSQIEETSSYLLGKSLGMERVLFAYEYADILFTFNAEKFNEIFKKGIKEQIFEKFTNWDQYNKDITPFLIDMLKSMRDYQPPDQPLVIHQYNFQTTSLPFQNEINHRIEQLENAS